MHNKVIRNEQINDVSCTQWVLFCVNLEGIYGEINKLYSVHTRDLICKQQNKKQLEQNVDVKSTHPYL